MEKNPTQSLKLFLEGLGTEEQREDALIAQRVVEIAGPYGDIEQAAALIELFINYTIKLSDGRQLQADPAKDSLTISDWCQLMSLLMPDFAPDHRKWRTAYWRLSKAELGRRLQELKEALLKHGDVEKIGQ